MNIVFYTLLQQCLEVPDFVILHAGFEVILIATILISTASIAVGFMFRQNQDFKNDPLSPNSLNDFNVTLTKEGTVVPLLYGTVRTEGNIIWYGNLQTEEIIIEQEEPEGGKGAPDPPGGGSQSGGFRYFLDIWQAMAQGKYTLGNIYVNDKVQTIGSPPNPGFEDSESQAASYADSIDFNDGTGSFFPPAGSKANRIPGVCHITFSRLYLGDNTTAVPTIHFVLTRDMNHSPVSNHTLSTGTNPAAIIYDLLIMSGILSSEIVLSSFNAAANYWNTKNYGLNIKFSSQEYVLSMIEKVLSQVDGILYQDFDGNYNLVALDPNDSSVRTLTDSDFKELSWTSGSWEDVDNEFRGTFTDQTQDFTTRVTFVDNPAAIYNAGGIKKKSTIDLFAYGSVSIASKRTFQLMQTLSFPGKVITFVTSLKHSDLLPGQVISLSSALHGFSGVFVRIMTIDMVGTDSNEIQFQARQMVEKLHHARFVDISDSSFVAPVTTPAPLTKLKIFELPYTSAFQENPAYLVLAARETLTETGYTVFSSNTSGSGFRSVGTFTTFSQFATLQEEYASTTRRLDQQQGILINPYKWDANLAANQSKSFVQLFTDFRFAIIGNEIIAFQTVTPEGVSDYRLTNCIRGVLNTPVETHAIGADVWLVTLASNVIKSKISKTQYYQVLPQIGSSVLNPPQTEISYVLQNKAKKPYQPANARIVRTGLDIVVDIFCTSPGVVGSSSLPPDTYTDQYPFQFRGDFLLTWPGSTDIVYTTANAINITLPGGTGAFTFSVKSRLNGFISAARQVSVGSADGTYWK